MAPIGGFDVAGSPLLSLSSHYLPRRLPAVLLEVHKSLLLEEDKDIAVEAGAMGGEGRHVVTKLLSRLHLAAWYITPTKIRQQTTASFRIITQMVGNLQSRLGGQNLLKYSHEPVYIFCLIVKEMLV